MKAATVLGTGVRDDFKAFVIVGGAGNNGMRASDACCDHRAYAFDAFSSALAFMRSTKSQSVIVEFSVETDTLDFYDAAKLLNVPVVFSVNRLQASEVGQFGMRVSEIVFPTRLRTADCRVAKASAVRLPTLIG
ncbi:MAG: hypothetical protein QM780_18010 [Hyphomicrobium sp.]|uniref:hypothetical protein n=1 Tax=Hyphomicrobium sp. TaxID=82 RepID=UPI0039E65CC5